MTGLQLTYVFAQVYPNIKTYSSSLLLFSYNKILKINSVKTFEKRETKNSEIFHQIPYWDSKGYFRGTIIIQIQPTILG